MKNAKMQIVAGACLVGLSGPAAPASAELRRIEVDMDRSSIAARTGRAGLLGFLGHEHGVLATRWSTSLCVDPQEPSALRGTITVPVGSLHIDTPAALEAVGLEESVDAAQREELQQKLLSPRFLDAEAHEESVFRVTSFERDGETDGRVGGEMTLRGVTREVAVPVAVSVSGTDRVVVHGSFELLQTDYGITPESVAGVVDVADAVDVRFRLSGAVTASPCELP